MENKTVLATVIGDILLAAALLTRIPVPAQDWARQSNAAWAYPLAGALVGGLAAVAALVAATAGLPPALAALAVLACLIVLTGAMHEDGLADVADGFWGGWTRSRRLEIMKDSHVGTYGAVALILSLGARWAVLGALLQAGTGVAVPAILAAAILSRASLPVLMTALPNARATGLSQSVGPVAPRTAFGAAGVAITLSILLLGSGAFWPVIWVGLVSAAMAALARHKIGGQTGDVLGATQQLTEIAVLISILI